LMNPDYQSVVQQAVVNLLNELKLSLAYYQDHVRGAESVQTLFVAGGGFRLVPNLKQIEESINIPTCHPDILSRISVNTRLDPSLLKKNEDLIWPALGVCLR